MNRYCLILALHSLALPLQTALADNLPPSPTYRGEIRRDADGNLTAAPPPAPEPAPARPAPAAIPTASAPPPSPPAGARPVKPAEAAVAKTAAPENLAPRVIHVGPNSAVRTLAAAAKMARDGDTVEIEPGDYVGDVAVWLQDRLTLRASQGRARLVAAGANAEGKAIWVMRGGKVTIENIDFTGARVRDRNGAGIRLEKGHLLVRNCTFTDNENGILVANIPDIELDIENSEFGHNGYGDGQSHGIYVGQIRRLSVVGSYFHHGKVGHLLKSRARENYVAYNRLTDETGGRASYELEFPAGGLAYVIGNIIEQSAQTENSTIISFGAEGYYWPNNELYLINNTIVDNRPANGIFLRVRAGEQVFRAVNNIFVGKGSVFLGTQEIKQAALPNNVVADPGVFAQASSHDYRLQARSAPVGKFVDPGSVREVKLSPQREYLHPHSSRALGKAASQPGALQTLAQPR